MPGPRRTLDEYISDRTAQLADIGARVDDIAVVSLKSPQRAILNARLVFQGEVVRAVLKVFEEIRIADGRPHRFRYAYDVRHEKAGVPVRPRPDRAS